MTAQSTARKPAFAIGARVRWHPDTNRDLDERKANDRGTVLRCEPSQDVPRLDVVTVLWDSALEHLTDRQQDRPCSTYARTTAATRLTLASPGR